MPSMLTIAAIASIWTLCGAINVNLLRRIHSAENSCPSLTRHGELVFALLGPLSTLTLAVLAGVSMWTQAWLTMGRTLSQLS